MAYINGDTLARSQRMPSGKRLMSQQKMTPMLKRRKMQQQARQGRSLQRIMLLLQVKSQLRM